jgi:hypothetical protein
MRQASCFPLLSTTYLLPAIFLNPALVLHLINTFMSHLQPQPSGASGSPHPRLQALGPVPGSTPYLDMHADEQLCWRYTAVMVVVQLLAIGSVKDNRGRRRGRLQRLAEGREKTREETRHRAFIDSCVESGMVPVAVAVNGQESSNAQRTPTTAQISENGSVLLGLDTEGGSTETSEEENFS